MILIFVHLDSIGGTKGKNQLKFEIIYIVVKMLFLLNAAKTIDLDPYSKFTFIHAKNIYRKNTIC